MRGITEDNSAKVIRQASVVFKSKQDEMAGIVEQNISIFVPVKTGATRDSIGHEVEDKILRIGVGTSYSPLVETNRPFLRPALELSMDELQRVLNK